MKENLLAAFALVVALGALGVVVYRYVPVAAPAEPAPLRLFVARMAGEDYRVEAHEFRIEGFCTVFVRGGRPFASICGQHTVSEAVEVE